MTEPAQVPPHSGAKEALQVVKRLGPASVLALLGATLPALGGIALLYYVKDLGPWLRSHGTQGLLAYGTLFALLSGLALIPTYASSIVGGWAFGVARGLPAALLGFVGGSLIAYAIARRTAATRVEGVLGEHPKWKAVRDALVGGGTLKTLGIVTLVRTPPTSPFAITNLVLASVRVPVWIYALGTLVGMAPRTAFMVYLASSVRDLREAAEHPPVWWVIGGAAMFVGVLALLAKIANAALMKVTGQKPPAPR